MRAACHGVALFLFHRTHRPAPFQLLRTGPTIADLIRGELDNPRSLVWRYGRTFDEVAIRHLGELAIKRDKEWWADLPRREAAERERKADLRRILIAVLFYVLGLTAAVCVLAYADLIL